jgi:tetratricopeptide (TPR) repeat protein
LRARTLIKKRDYAAAIADCTQAIEIDPKSGFAYGGRAAKALLRSGRAADALPDADQAVGLLPDLAKAHAVRARVETMRSWNTSARSI